MEKDPSSLTQPVRVTLLTCLFTELKLRVEELQTEGEHQQVVTQKLVKLGRLVLEPTALNPTWRYVRWNAEKKCLEPDMTRNGTTLTAVLSELEAILALLKVEGTVTRFHPSLDIKHGRRILDVLPADGNDDYRKSHVAT